MSDLSERQRENLEVTRRGYELFNAGDLEGFLGLCHEEVEVYLPSGEGPMEGTYRGHDGVRGWYREWLESFDDYTAEVRKIDPVGERHVVTLARQSAKGKGSGVPVEMDSGNLLEFRDGKLITLHLYIGGRERALEVARRREGGEPDAKG
jgi:ketosteroid isomerase-like protein